MKAIYSAIGLWILGLSLIVFAILLLERYHNNPSQPFIAILAGIGILVKMAATLFLIWSLFALLSRRLSTKD